MKIGIMSDSHDNIAKIVKAVEVFNTQGVECVFHAGDIISPFTAIQFKELKSKLVVIFGNNDGEKTFLYERFKPIADIYKNFFGSIDGDKVKLAMFHEPEEIDFLRDTSGFDLIIYGHTHKVDIRKGKVMVVNPGETCGYLSGKATVAVLDTAGMKCEVIEL